MRKQKNTRLNKGELAKETPSATDATGAGVDYAFAEKQVDKIMNALAEVKEIESGKKKAISFDDFLARL